MTIFLCIIVWFALGGLGVIIARKRWFQVFGNYKGIGITIQVLTIIAGLPGLIGAATYYYLGRN